LDDADVVRSRLDHEVKRQTLGISSSRIAVLSAARLIPWKGQANLIKAMAIAVKEVDSLVLLIAGSGMEDAGLRQLAKDLGLGADQIIFLGPRSDVPEIMAVTDVFSSALSYPPDFVSESIGLATLEAMAFSLPVIVGDYPGVDKVVKDKVNGLVVSPNDEQQLAKAILSLAKNQTLRQDLGKSARQLIADQFSWSRISLLYQNLYKLLVED